MARIEDSVIEEILSSINISSEISKYVDLKKSGNSYKGLCPFHNEKTPSFIVNEEKRIYKCFGCGEGGNVINFIMKRENLSFVEAVEKLAETIGIEVKSNSFEDNKYIKEKNLLKDINLKAAKYFHENLKNNKIAIKYFLDRQIPKNIIKSFGLGFSENSWDDLYKYLKKLNYKDEDILKSGLLVEGKNDSKYNRFRNRVMFPIFDISNNVIGFGARVLDDTMPKYLNSPESNIFNKRKILYNLNRAKKNINNNQLILVEGYMDVLALYKNDIKNVVATLGTSLTKEHGDLIKRYVDELILVFDGDEAGKKATLRSIDTLKDSGLSIKILRLPKLVDPDDFINKKGRTQFIKKIDEAIDEFEFKLLLLKENYNLNIVSDRIKFFKEVINLIASMKSPIIKEAYIDKISKEFNLTKTSIEKELKVLYNSKSKERKTYNKSNNYSDVKEIDIKIQKDGHELLEQNILKYILTNPEEIDSLTELISYEDFLLEKHKKLAKIIIEKLKNGYNITNIKESLDEDALINYNDILNMKDVNKGINNILDEFFFNLSMYKLIFKRNELELEQKKIIEKDCIDDMLNEKLMNIGKQIFEINKELQDFKYKGRR